MSTQEKATIIIQSIQWTGSNLTEIDSFFSIEGERIGGHGFISNDETMFVDTPQGKAFAYKGDYIIKWDNEFFVCTEETFNTKILPNAQINN